jgi:putative ABC transport system permease protein
VTPIVRMIASVRERLRGLFLRNRIDAEMEEELRYHMELEAGKLERAGLAPQEASRVAAATLGGIERTKDEVRDARGLAWIPGTKLDFILGLRMMRKHPALSIVGGFGMAVGVAMSVGMFVFIRANIYPTIPLDEGDRIVALENRDATVNNEDRRAIHDFLTWRRELKSVVELGAFQNVSRNVTIGEGEPQLVRFAEMTAAGFRVARVQPLMGRYFVADDERIDRPAVLVIGHDVWKTRFGGRADVIGQSVKVGRVGHTIVGVMPEGFAFPIRNSWWIPLRAEAAASASRRRQGPFIYIFGRLADGATLESAQAELSEQGRRAAAQFPENAKIEPMVMPYIHSITDIQGITTWPIIMMQAMMTLLLVVVAVNVAMLVYARTAARQGEIAVRTALGASRTRIVSQLFIEALTLALVSSVVGVAIAYFGVSLGQRIMEGETGGNGFWITYRPDPWIALYAVGIAVFTAVIVGVLPALQATGKRLEVNLRSLGGAALRLGRTWTALVIAQVAIAVAALPATVNFAWTEMRNAFTKPAYDSRYYLTASLQDGGEDETVAATNESRTTGDQIVEILRRLEESPAIEDAAYRTSFAARRGQIEAENVDPPQGALGFRAGSYGVSPDYFALYGLRLLGGRPFSAPDMDTAATAVIVSQAFATKVFGTSNALGRRVRYAARPAVGDPSTAREASRWYEIVGVVANERVNDAAPELILPELYYAVAPDVLLRGEEVVIDARMQGTAMGPIVPIIRQVVSQVNPTLRVNYVRQQSNEPQQAMAVARLMALGLGLVLASVFLLSAAGIYALVSFTVTRRRKEIGIRSALGATQRQVLGAILRPIARQIVVGVVIGLAGAAVIDKLSGGEMLGGRGAYLLPAFAIAMSIVAILAALGPTRRGLRTQPTEALRAEA